MSLASTVNKVCRWPSAFVMASGDFTPIAQMPLIHAEHTVIAWHESENLPETETEELSADTQFMQDFNRGVNELDRGEGIAWDDLKKQLGI